MARSVVAVVKTQPDSILPDIGRIMDQAGLSATLPLDRTVILKDNISWHLLFPGANTTPWQLEGTILKLREAGYPEITAVQNETVVTDAYKGERLNKYIDLFKRYDIQVLYNFLPEMKWIHYQPKFQTIFLHKLFPDGIYIPEYFLGKSIIHLPTVKSHIYTTTTGAMKNAFGGLLNRKRHYTHSHIHETLVDLLALQQEIHSGVFCVMDGTTMGSGPGPRTMVPVQGDLMLAASDQVAIDAISAKIMGFDPLTIPYIRMAHERGLGCGDTREIEVVGYDIDKLSYHFKVGDNLASRAGDMIWFGPLKPIHHLLTHTPIVYMFIFASFFYHDYLWYPFKGKPQVRRWLAESPWGNLFQRYT